MPGKQVKNWKKYHALRRKGHTKKSAARIANAGGGGGKKRKRGRKSKSRRRKKS